MPIVVANDVKKMYIHCNYEHYRGDCIFLLDFAETAKKYHDWCIEGTSIKSYFSRVFNEEHNVVDEPRTFVDLSLVRASLYPDSPKEYMKGFEQANGYFLNLDEIVKKNSIPDGYTVEFLLISFVNTPKYGERVIFPNETRIHAPKEILDKVKEKCSSLTKIGLIAQSHSFLASLGLKDVSNELSLAYSKFEEGDCDGTVKHYRNVVEGFRNYFSQKEDINGKVTYKHIIDNSQDRTEKMIDLLKQSYNVLSNFGEHIGTHATFDKEGIFAHRLVEDITEYLNKKLKN